METFDAIKERRSVKHYDQNHSLTEDEINQLMSLAVYLQLPLTCRIGDLFW